MGKHLPLKETAFKYTARKKDKKKRKKVVDNNSFF
jgi:hypothetical protein